jgi:trans-aconitate 2-methyltransferase
MATTETWDPAQYERFKRERRQPFDDLLELVQARGPARVVDLGCGPGGLTRELHEHLGAATTVGIDSSAAMLAEAEAHAGGGLSFRAGDMGDLDALALDGPLDVVFSNAALQWLPDHAGVLGRWAAALGPGGELAVQVPAMADQPSHRLIQELAGEAPYAEVLAGAAPGDDPIRPVLRPEEYARVLHDLGFEQQHVRLQVYGHLLPSTDAVVEWTKGTTLNPLRRRLSEGAYGAFVDEYRRRLVAELGDERPYFFAFKRILFWGRR